MGNFNINKQEACELIQNLVRIPSVNPPGVVDQCADYIVKWLEKQHISAEVIRVDHVANVVARIGKKGGKRLLWNGHIDTVPIGNEKHWDVGPFSGKLIDGFVYGRGSSDMKGGIASFMLGLKELKRKEEALNGEVVLMCSGDEETGSQRGTIYLLNNIESDFDAAVVSEPTNLRLEYGQRGLRWFEIMVTGKSCHAGRPYAGKNAVEYAIKIATKLKEIKFDKRVENFEVNSSSLSVTMIQGGVKANIICDTCKITLDRRLIPGETEEIARAEIQKVINDLKEDGFQADLSIINKGWDPFVISKEEEIYQKTENAYLKIMQKIPNSLGKGACTDASHIHSFGIPTLIFGPGDTLKSHTANECVVVYEIAKCAEICAEAAVEFFKKKVGG